MTDLDRLMAEKVMGWELDGRSWFRGGAHVIDAIQWHPTTNMNQAMMCVEKFKGPSVGDSYGWTWAIELNYVDHGPESVGWVASVHGHESEFCASPAMALCEAMKLAVEAKGADTVTWEDLKLDPQGRENYAKDARINDLVDRLEASKARVRELEEKRGEPKFGPLLTRVTRERDAVKAQIAAKDARINELVEALRRAWIVLDIVEPNHPATEGAYNAILKQLNLDPQSGKEQK